MSEGPCTLEEWKALALQYQKDLEEQLETSDELEAALEEELSKATKECERLGDVVQGRENELEKIRLKLKESKDALDRSQQSHQTLLGKKEDLEARTRQLETRDDELEKQVRNLEATVEDSKRQLDEMIEQVAFLQGEKEESEERIERLRTEVKDLQSELEVLRQQSGPESSTDDALKEEQRSDFEANLKALNAELETQIVSAAEWKVKYDVANQQLEDLQKRYTKMVEEQNGLESLQLEWKSKVEVAQQRIEELESNIQTEQDAQDLASSEKESLVQLKEQLTKMQKDYEISQVETIKLKNELSAALESATDQKEPSQVLEDKIKALKKRLEQEQQARIATQEELDLLRSTETCTSVDTIETSARAAELNNGQISKLESENEDLRSINERFAKQLSKLEKDLEMEKEKSAKVEDLKKENALIQSELDNVREQLEEVQKMYNTLQTSSKELEGNRADRDSLLNQIETDGKKVEILQEELEAARCKNQEIAILLERERERLQIVEQTTTQNGALPNDVIQLRRAYTAQLRANSNLLARMQALRGNVIVCCRIRPMLAHERQGTEKRSAVEALSSEELSFSSHKPNEEPRPFAFDRVFPPAASQSEVCHELGMLGIAESVVGGTNACIMAYGQTGSGKTFTMDGPEDSHGVNAVTIKRVFELVSMLEQASQAEYAIHLSMIEIYNDEVVDLLNVQGRASTCSNTTDSLSVASNSTSGGSQRMSGSPSQQSRSKVAGASSNLTWVHCDNLETVDTTLRKGRKNRSTASTNLNLHSSRSHLIILLEVTATTQISGTDNTFEDTEDKISGKTVQTGLLYLVDLAGSERISKSGVEGSQLDEAKHINLSLSALGDVMQALDSKDRKHVPYRNSKLTHLLKPVLSGNARTVMILAVPPTLSSASETLQSLNFCARARKIELGPAKRQVQMKADIQDRQKYRDQIATLRGEKTRLEAKLAGMIRETHIQSQAITASKVQGSKKEEAHRKRLELQLSSIIRENEELKAKYTIAREDAKTAKTDVEQIARKMKNETKIMEKASAVAADYEKIIEKQRLEIARLKAGDPQRSYKKNIRARPTGIATPKNKLQQRDSSPHSTRSSKGNTVARNKTNGTTEAGFGSGAPRFRSKIPRPSPPTREGKKT